MDGINKIPYTFSVMINDTKSVVHYLDNDSEQWDLKVPDYTITYMKINIKNDRGEFEPSITRENPLLLELEYI
jgi:hypothetical protein